MIPATRLAAAIEVLAAVDKQRRPVAEVLKDWGQAHRFAGSGDRSAIASLLFDTLRRRASSRWIMGADTPRATLLGALRQARLMSSEAIAALCTGERHAADPLSNDERTRLATATLDDAPDHVRGDYPEWLAGAFAEAFGSQAVAQGQALSARAPVDLRVNTLKVGRDKALADLAHLDAAPTALSPFGLRIELQDERRAPALQAEPAYVRGQVEVQDEGSQLAAILAGAEAGTQILDLCAGAGGKALALSALLDNRGQIYATDTDGRRLMPIYARLERAGVHNVQVRAPRGSADVLGDLIGRCDLVVVDAPCTGSGAWRRNPDAKWRTRPGALEQRQRDQDRALASAARYVKPGGAIAYITCSVLRAENEERVASFLGAHADFMPRDAAHMARLADLPALAAQASAFGPGIRLSPLTTQTDGFYVAVLARVSDG